MKEARKMSGAENHVFIVGLVRTGTSIMYRTIQKLPGFKSIKLNFVETKIFMKDITFDTLDLYYPSLLRYFYHNKEVYRQFLSSVSKYTDRLRARKENQDYSMVIRDQGSGFQRIGKFKKNKWVELRWKRSCQIKIIRQYFAWAQKYRQAKRMVEKTPHHYMHVHQILWTFPQARIIWMIRHPIDILTSSLSRAQSDARHYKNYWSIESFIEEFKTSFLYYDFYKRLFPGKIILIKYEDFVNRPSAELMKICHLINETYSEDCLMLANHEIPKWTPHSPHIFSEIVKKTDRNWRDFLTLEEAEKIEASLKGVMEKYNFPSYLKA